MGLFLNSFYLLALALASPWLAWRFILKGRSFTNFLSRFTGETGFSKIPDYKKTIWFHGVSVGEIHLLRQLISTIRETKPDWQCVVSSSTDNGLMEARKCFNGLHVFAFPLDFTWAIYKSISQIKSDLVVLAESELWPNFINCCKLTGVPVSIINGRMSPKTQSRYMRFPRLAKSILSKIKCFAVQNTDTEIFLHKLGVTPSSTLVTGSIKFDGVKFSRSDPNVEKFKKMFGINNNEIIWVAGSTQEPEELFVLNAYAELKKEFPMLRLIIVPRQPDLFNNVKKLIESKGLPFKNRSELETSTAPEGSIILVDSLGELRFIWGLAELAFVGGSMDGKRGGQNMIEPAAYGASVFFGDKIWNFKQVATQLIEAGGAKMVSSPSMLADTAKSLLTNEILRQEMGIKAKNYVVSQQGATLKTINMIESILCKNSLNQAA